MIFSQIWQLFKNLIEKEVEWYQSFVIPVWLQNFNGDQQCGPTPPVSIFARTGLRLPSDLTDAEWAVLEPLLPSRSTRGPPPLWTYRDIMEALLYLLHGRLPWRTLPPDVFHPMTTVQHYFYEWRDLGLWSSINHALLMMVRETVGREASPSAGIIDSQSV